MPNPTRRIVLLSGAAVLAGCQAQPGGTTATSGGLNTSGLPAVATSLQSDPDMGQVISTLSQLGAKPVSTLTVDQARSQPSMRDAVIQVQRDRSQASQPRPVAEVRDLTIPGPGGPIQARLFRGSTSREPLPLIVFWHGGGWVVADIGTYEASARALAALTGAVVLSAHYRQAPEHKFPAAHEDAAATYAWAVANARSLGADPARVAVAGESAGGNLAINAAIAARDRGLPKPAHMLLIYPVAGVDTNTASYQENTAAIPLSRADLQWFIEKVARDTNDLRDPRLDLVGRADLRGLPPATIILAQIDPLRSDGEQLATKLRSVGVPVELQVWSGVTHEFFGTAPVVNDATEAQAFAAFRLRSAFGQPTLAGI